jgi:tRNA nucleotidyltransferase (CCA-adding enzyme)
MEIYLVGGALRDECLGLPVKERDWVVVGVTVDDMLAQGYTPVGKDFPVFLHPESKEEYALARTERKVSKGYKGFTFYADPSVTLVQDLQRRDLTINAMARPRSGGEMVDPHGGQRDCNHKLLRHVSSAFVEDPVRVLRLARFAAKLPDFTVADETKALVQTMVASGELHALVPERVWQELSKALQASSPRRFFQVLHEGGALAVLMPEILSLGEDDFSQVDVVSDQLETVALRFAALWGGAGDKEAIEEMTKRVRVPASIMDIACLVASCGRDVAQLLGRDAQVMLGVFERLDAFRREARFWSWFDASCVAYGVSVDRAWCLQALHCCQNVSSESLQGQGLAGEDFAKALRVLRLKHLGDWLQ